MTYIRDILQKQEEADGKLCDYTALIREEYENADEILSGFSAPDPELNELSVACGYSREHLGRTIKRFTGKTFSEHLGDFRAERAKRLLTDTSLTIDEIARMTGFKTRSDFRKNFSERFGVSPAVYRNSLK